MADPIAGVPGYFAFDPDLLVQTTGQEDWSPEKWAQDYEQTLSRLRASLSVRDPWIILSGSTWRFIVEMSEHLGQTPVPESGRLPAIEQADIELLQALALAAPVFKNGPSSPGSHVRCWEQATRLTAGFIRKQAEGASGETRVRVIRRARLQTLYYRNLFDRPDCETVVGAILSRCDALAEARLGFALSALFRAMVGVFDAVMARVEIFRGWLRRLWTGDEDDVFKAIAFFRGAWPSAEAVWRRAPATWPDLETLRYAAFQMAEQAKPWAFVLTREALADFAEPQIVEALFGLALEPGALVEQNTEHFHLNNPIWSRPYIALDSDRLFAPLAQLVFSFPFAIVEGVIKGQPDLEAAYEKARSDELEAQIEAALGRAMPEASVHSSVMWKDDLTGKTYENDVVAVIGNLLLVFEAKSGRIKDAARRGGLASLETNFKELFVEPGVQGWRLQDYLNRHGPAARLWRKSDGTPIDLGLDTPKIVCRFSICIEHFAGLTSARHHLKALGLVADDEAWAPVLTLGELLMIEQLLDSQLSFIHYLSRRAGLEDQIDFDGDEQDLLSLYLTNGLYLTPEELDGRTLMFLNADTPVRGPRAPRSGRTRGEVHGVSLSPFWKATIAELARNPSNRHRFDLCCVILNQHPGGLADMERQIRRWRRSAGRSDQDVVFLDYKVAGRTFLLVARLLKRQPDPDAWHEDARDLARSLLTDGDQADVAVFAIVRNSRQHTFDGYSFFRVSRKAKPSRLVGAPLKSFDRESRP